MTDEPIVLTGAPFPTVSSIEPSQRYDGSLFAANRVLIDDESGTLVPVLIGRVEGDCLWGVSLSATGAGAEPTSRAVSFSRSAVYACEQRMSLDAGRGFVHDTALDVVLACRVDEKGSFMLRPLDARRGYSYSLNTLMHAFIRCSDALFELDKLTGRAGVDLGIRQARGA